MASLISDQDTYELIDFFMNRRAALMWPFIELKNRLMSLRMEDYTFLMLMIVVVLVGNKSDKMASSIDDEDTDDFIEFFMSRRPGWTWPFFRLKNKLIRLIFPHGRPSKTKAPRHLRTRRGRPLPLKNIIEEGKEVVITNLPTIFDARDKWSHCKSLQEVRNQGPCGSCWAVSAAAVFTDRLCIATNGTFNGYLSSKELQSSHEEQGDVCDGGHDHEAWRYIASHGLVDYKSSEGCQPTFRGKKYPDPFTLDVYRAKYAYRLQNDVKTIQWEIMSYGPVVAGMQVFLDFFSYKPGVYKHNQGAYEGEHSVKVLGWGEENGEAYWLVANSWGRDWGDEGFFKISRGNNECGIEGEVSAGIPLL